MPSKARGAPAEGRRGWSLRAKGIVLITILMLPLVASSIAFAVAVHARNQAAAAIDHSLAVEGNLQGVLTEMLNAETGIRGYVATGNATFLQPYPGTKDRVQQRLASLDRTVEPGSVQADGVQAVRANVQRQLALLATVLSDDSRGIREELLLHGKSLMDRIRAELTTLRQRESNALAESRATRARIITQTSYVIVAGLVLGLIGAIVATALAATWVVRRMRRLERNAERLAAEQPIEPVADRADEIGRVEQAMRHASDLLRARRERLVTAMEGGRVLAWELDLGTSSLEYDGDPEVLNRAGFPVHLLPTTTDEWLESVHPEDRLVVETLLEGTRTDGEPFEVEYRRPFPDGGWAWRAVRGRVVRPDPDLPGIIRGVTLDITGQKESEQLLARQNEALRESEHRYRMLARYIPDALVMMFDRDLRYTMAEGAALDPARRDRHFYEGKTLYDMTPPDRAELLADQYRRALAGESVVIEWPMGEQHWLISTSPVRDDDGEVVGGVSVATDVTQLKRAREDLVRERGMLQAVLDNMVEGVVMANERGEFVVFNPAAEDILGTGATDAGPSQWSEEYGLFLGDGETPFPPHELPLARALEGESADEVEILSRHRGKPDGVLLEVTGRPIHDEEGQRIGGLAVFRDVTEKHRVQEELAQHRSELERSNAELEQFAYVASHDLQEPLRMVASYTQLLSRRYRGKLDEDADEFIGYAVGGATRMQALINDLLAYSRVQRKELELTAVDTGQAVKAAVQNLHAAIEERDAIVAVDDDLPAIQGDMTQLTQLFQNLIGNALKFSTDGRPEVHVSVRRRPGEWVFSVSDNGIGIDPQHAERIFEVFQRLHTRQEYPGTGIGLAVCKKIVERIGGRIWVQSEPGAGATFSFAVPAERRSGHARIPTSHG
jgi:PAS domain S-box-containing protein